MTVKDLEETLGMTRANIRFYEREGLLSPARLENGYRDYTEEDLDTLRKIKLLRQLQLDLEDIRSVQRGERDLSAVLEERERSLLRARSDLDAARALCRQIREEGTGYGALDAGRYLEELGRLEREGVTFPALRSDFLPMMRRPWVRFFARSVDFHLCQLPLWALVFLVLRFPLHHLSGPMASLVLGYLTYGIVLVTEPILLATWGYTPGKWLFGLRVRNIAGGKLSWEAAKRRTLGVFGRGEGWNIPIYNLWRNWKSYAASRDGETLPWEEEFTYTIDDRGAKGWVGAVALWLVTLVLALGMGLSVLVPLGRAPLSVAEFARSYNDVAVQYESGDSYSLDENGQWERLYGREMHYRDAVTGETISDRPADFVYDVVEGAVVGVTVEEHREPSLLMSGGWDLNLALTLLGAESGGNPFGWMGVLRDLPEELNDSHGNWTVSYRGVTMTNTVEHQGYELIGGVHLWPQEGEAQTYHRVFSIQLADD